jgi:hypothetical protein
MELIRSNRTENLADALASRVREKPLGPFQKEVVVVQNRGLWPNVLASGATLRFRFLDRSLKTSSSGRSNNPTKQRDMHPLA